MVPLYKVLLNHLYMELILKHEKYRALKIYIYIYIYEQWFLKIFVREHVVQYLHLSYYFTIVIKRSLENGLF
jgi:hypothetical protein